MSDLSPVVFLHGFLGAKDDWKMVADKLGSTLMKLGVDLPGHGESHVGANAFSFDGCSLLIVESVAAMGVRRFSLVGYSMGGRIALYLATRYPQFVERLALISASPGLESEIERTERARNDDSLAMKLEAEGLPTFLDDWYGQPLFASLKARPELLAKVIERRGKGSSRSLAKALKSLSAGRQPSLWEELRSLTVPALFIAGEMDSKYASLARRMADLCPNGKPCIIAQAGHAVHLEQPWAVAEQLNVFLAEG